MKLRILVTIFAFALATATCGDGHIDVAAGEECDDHNRAGLDGCSPDCKIDEGFECFQADISHCFRLSEEIAQRVALLETTTEGLLDASVLVYTDAHPEGVIDHALAKARINQILAQQEEAAAEEDCVPPVHFTRTSGVSVIVATAAVTDAEGACGNGAIDSNDENCDDGNRDDHDGCDSSCHVECGFDCSSGRCQTVCGDGIKAGTEHCDAVVGCTDKCVPAPGYDCDPIKNECTHECGNGHVEDTEECDGGHHIIGNFPDPACSEQCTINPGWICNSDGECTKDCPEGEVNANVAAALAALK